MSGIAGDPAASPSPWRRYRDREQAARDHYLAMVSQAHQEYLTGPWPDRDAYTLVERHAWATYYAAGRHAWQDYRAEVEQAATVSPGPAAPRHPYPGGTPDISDGRLDYPQPTFTQYLAGDH